MSSRVPAFGESVFEESVFEELVFEELFIVLALIERLLKKFQLDLHPETL
jgi:hypothetical protein